MLPTIIMSFCIWKAGKDFSPFQCNSSLSLSCSHAQALLILLWNLIAYFHLSKMYAKGDLKVYWTFNPSVYETILWKTRSINGIFLLQRTPVTETLFWPQKGPFHKENHQVLRQLTLVGIGKSVTVANCHSTWWFSLGEGPFCDQKKCHCNWSSLYTLVRLLQGTILDKVWFYLPHSLLAPILSSSSSADLFPVAICTEWEEEGAAEAPLWIQGIFLPSSLPSFRENRPLQHVMMEWAREQPFIMLPNGVAFMGKKVTSHCPREIGPWKRVLSLSAIFSTSVNIEDKYCPLLESEGEGLF